MRLLSNCCFGLLVLLGAGAASGFSREGMPFRCEVTITSAQVEDNIPITCETLDGVSFTRVPENQYLFVTDVKITRRLTSQTEFLADIRIWEVDAGGGLVQFVTNYVYRVNYAQTPDGVTESYQMPFLIARPGEALYTYHYNSASSGHVMRISGVLASTLVGSVDVFRDGFESSLLALNLDTHRTTG